MRIKRLGPEHADVAGTMTLLAGVLIETKRYDEALQLSADAHAMYLKSLGREHWRTASAASAEGAARAGLEAIRAGRTAARGRAIQCSTAVPAH